jgi:hypothetical protein
MFNRLVMCASILTVLTLSGCSSDDSVPLLMTPDPETPPADGLVVKNLEVSGTTADTSSVTVNGVADQDATDDQTWHAGFALDGAAAADSLPKDSGDRCDVDLHIKATRTSDNAEANKSVSITIYGQ